MDTCCLNVVINIAGNYGRSIDERAFIFKETLSNHVFRPSREGVTSAQRIERPKGGLEGERSE